MPTRQKRGFTLIELLVVISIIALLVSILMPALTRAKQQAQFAVCKANLRQYGIAMNLYLQDSDDRFPEAHTSLFRGIRSECQWHDARNDYEADTSVRGPMLKYLSDMDVHLCPTFMRFAARVGEQHLEPFGRTCSVPMDPQYSYSQNKYLGGTNSNGEYVGVSRLTQIKNPGEVIFFVEETMWIIPGQSSHMLNDTCFWSRHPHDSVGYLGDSIAMYHNTTKKDEGNGNTVFADGHVDLSNVFEEFAYSWGKVTSSFKKSWPKGKIPEICPYQN